MVPFGSDVDGRLRLGRGRLQLGWAHGQRVGHQRSELRDRPSRQRRASCAGSFANARIYCGTEQSSRQVI